MPIFFFNITQHGDEEALDAIGSEFSEEDVKTEALQTLAEMTRDAILIGEDGNCRVSVRNSAGQEVFTCQSTFSSSEA